MNAIRFIFAMIGCAVLVQYTSFAAPSIRASGSEGDSGIAGNLHQSESSGATKGKLVGNETTKRRAPAVPPKSVVPPVGRSLKNARNQGSSPAIIGGPADAKRNNAAVIGTMANVTRDTATIGGTAVNRER
jgi:hypothetical protein